MPGGRAEKVGRDSVALERRRLKAARLLSQGITQAETARLVGVRRQSAHRWAEALEQGGLESLRRAARLGRKARLDDARQEELIRELRRGPRALGLGADDWTLKLVKDLIQKRYGIAYRTTPLLAQLLRQAGFEPCGRRGWRRRASGSAAARHDDRKK